jgi:hypothetical protein
VWHASLIFHVCEAIAILLHGKIWSRCRFSLKETTTELVDSLSEFVGVGDTAARIRGLAVRDEGSVGLEPFLAAGATALVDWMDNLEMLLVFGGGVEVFSVSVLAGW